MNSAGKSIPGISCLCNYPWSIGFVLVLVALAVTLFLKEIPLRKSNRMG